MGERNASVLRGQERPAGTERLQDSPIRRQGHEISLPSFFKQPQCRSRPMSVAGLLPAICALTARLAPVNTEKFRTARSMVSTLPARTPGDPAEVQRPLATSTSRSPSLYLPSGMPVALIPSVIRMDFSAPLAL